MSFWLEARFAFCDWWILFWSIILQVSLIRFKSNLNLSNSLTRLFIDLFITAVYFCFCSLICGTLQLYKYFILSSARLFCISYIVTSSSLSYRWWSTGGGFFMYPCASLLFWRIPLPGNFLADVKTTSTVASRLLAAHLMSVWIINLCHGQWNFKQNQPRGTGKSYLGNVHLTKRHISLYKGPKAKLALYERAPSAGCVPQNQELPTRIHQPNT